MGTCMVVFLGCYLVPIHASEANHAAGHICSSRNRPHLLATQPHARHAASPTADTGTAEVVVQEVDFVEGRSKGINTNGGERQVYYFHKHDHYTPEREIERHVEH